MTTYAFPASRYTTASDLQNAVGQQYHLGLSGPLGAGAGSIYYGYLLEPDSSKSGGFHQRSDTASKDALIQYSSQNLIDRDLAYFPRVTDGDFSGGGYQEVWLQQNRYFDSDLETSIPGFLELRSSWSRSTKTTITPTLGQVVAWKGDYWFTFGESNGHVYSANGGTTTTPFAASLVGLDTDGDYLYAGYGDRLRRSSDGSTWTTVTTTLNGTATNWWVVSQGTNGYFAYYTVAGTPNVLYKIDLTQTFPIAAAAQPQVPTGSNNFTIVDIVPYQTAISILTNDVQGYGCDVWYHDGTNMTRIARIDGYNAQGMCNGLGNLFVGASAVGNLTSPELIQISSGTLTVVAKPGSPFPAAGQLSYQPRASSNYVYWSLIAPSIKGISSANVVVLQYNLQTGAVTHLPNKGSDDGKIVSSVGLRGVAPLGDNLAMLFAVPDGINTDGVCQYQTWAFGTLTYSPSGWLVSSHIDFTTPGVSKRFRRIEVHHAPLNAGEQIYIEAHADQDPLGFTTSLGPTPASASATNSTVGSTLTAMTFGQDTIGKTLYFALKLTAGNSQLTTPRVSYVSIEVGGTWTWELNLACTSKRQLLDGQNEDTQGVKGQDLAYFILIAYEQGQNLTLYHRNGQSYTVAIESVDAWNLSPITQARSQDILDEEYIVNCTLRQVA